MKKKILIVAGAAIVIIGIVACCILIRPSTPTYPTGTSDTSAETTQEHIHNYQITESEDATCKKEGYAVYTCECGENYRSKIEKKDHEFELTEVVAATAEQAGFEKFRCRNCDEYYINELPILSANDTGDDNPNGTVSTEDNPRNEHFHDYYVADAKEPTCKEKGYTVYHCKNCEESYTVEAEIVNHYYELIAVVEATSEQEGFEEYTCKFCGLSFRVPLLYED